MMDNKLKNKEGLYNKLLEHNKNQVYPMHMPGHKRNLELMSMASPYSIDITEIDGFDNMHSASGIIKKIMDDASALYGSKRTWLSVNGSSIGIMAAICSVTHKGDTILISRGSHKSVYNAIELQELIPEYVFPESIGNGINGQIFLTDIKQKIEENPKICAVVVTNPTYEGVVSDIESIAKYLHSKGKVLIVDGAHGAHIGFHKEFTKSSIECGADIVIHSIHKTLPAFTQTSLVHLVNDKLVDEARLDKYISIFQSSSPSYILMSGIEKCIEILKNRRELFDEFDKNLQAFYKGVANLKCIKVLGYIDEVGKIWRDKSKIIIVSKCRDVDTYGGGYIYDKLLYEYNIQLEMKSTEYCLAMTSICDTKEGFERLLVALVKIDEEMSRKSEIVGNLVDKVDNLSVEKAYISTIWDYGPSETNVYSLYPPHYIEKLWITRTKILEAVDKASAEYVYLYPPGIPLIVPGELITMKFIETITEYKSRGLNIEGLEDEDIQYIKIAIEKKE